MTYMSLFSGMEYQVIIKSSTPEELLVPIMNYWLFEKNEFKFPVEEGDADEIVKTILFNSHCLLIFDSCLLCQMPIKITVQTRLQFINTISENKAICENCQLYSSNLENGVSIPDFLESSLNRLNEPELRVLKGIINLKTKFKIYRHIFNNDLEDADTWSIINSLQKKRLISIERDSSWKIKSFRYAPWISKYI